MSIEMYDTVTDNKPESPKPNVRVLRVGAMMGETQGFALLNYLAKNIHALNDHFYRDLETGQRFERNKAELIALIHSELSEMLEGVRKAENDKHLPHRSCEEVEAADVLIRLLDYCGYRGLDIAGAFSEKLAYNATRYDHTRGSRRTANGKKF